MTDAHARALGDDDTGGLQHTFAELPEEQISEKITRRTKGGQCTAEIKM
jgi:hypothetical protein